MMAEVKDTIHVNVEYIDGQDEGDDGNPYYVENRSGMRRQRLKPSGCQKAKPTEGAERQNGYFLAYLTPNPGVVVMMELPEHYAKTA